ncbi:hypothetical protein [Nocardia sp. NPDC004860]|uniref:hypothetical protein n=1 Tax=Nocardia sp. NPDC004860 TaxID=3154557 RepID=UPI0033B36BC0
MSWFSSSGFMTGPRKVQYKPAHTDRWGSNNQYEDEVPAQIWVYMDGDSSLSLSLSPEDAQVLMEHLAVALVEHAVALKDSTSGPKLVA